MQFVVKQCMVKRKKNHFVCVHEGEDAKRIVIKQVFGEVEEMQQDFSEIYAQIPVVDCRSVGRNMYEVPIYGVTLGKHFAQSSGLVHLPQTHDLQTKSGMRATYGVECRTHDVYNSENFFFVHEKILRAYLEKHKLVMIWAVWGERELSYKRLMEASHKGELDRFSHGDFQTIVQFK